MHAFNPIGKALNPLISSFSQWAFLLVCLVFTIIAYRRTKHSGLVFLLVGLGVSLFNRVLYTETGLNWWRSLDGTVFYTLLKLYDVFICHSVFWLCLAIAIWRLGINRNALTHVSTPNEQSHNG